MKVITARGSDSAEAMDEVIRLLGVNALILSTRVRDGMVEIEAADDMPERPSLRSVPERQEPAPQGQSFADLLEARSDWAPMPKLRPAVPPRRTPWAQVTPTRLQAALLDRLEADLLPPEPLTPGRLAPRTLILGPPGAGKSLLAVRLAAEAMLADRACQPQVIAPRMVNPLSDDRLRGWLRLLGLTADRPLIGDLMAEDETLTPVENRPQIIDLSDIPQATPELATALARLMPTEVILALPAGLSARQAARLARHWAPAGPGICLTFTDLGAPEQALLLALAEAGLRLTRAARGTGIIETLSLPDRAEMARWLQEEPQEDTLTGPEARA